MLKIRLTRTGKKNDPKYRLILIEEYKRRDGRYIENLGFYDPIPQPHILKVDIEKIKVWIGKGAQLSDGARKLLKSKIK